MYRSTQSRTSRYLLSTLVFFLFSYSPVMATGIFKCVKPNGEVEYTQSPPPDCQASEMKNRGGKADKKAQKKFNSAQKQKQLSTEEKRTEKLKRQDLATHKKQKKQYCADLKGNLGRLLSNPRIYKTDPDGNRVLLDEQQRQQRIQEHNDDIAQHCP